jgi:hypothetical protein
MKVTIILAGILAANVLAVAQDPSGITTAQTSQVHQPAVFPDTFRPQQLTATNQLNGGSSTNVPSSMTTSTNVSGTSTTGSGTSTNVSGTSTTSRPITIIHGGDTSTGSTGNGQLPPAPKDNGIDPVKSTAGTPDDWRSGSSGPHMVPPRNPPTNP